MLKITYITHSSILIETEDAKVISDPWFFGPAYLNQWHVFPKPVDVSYAKDITHVIITHGHEDHCHFPTLNQLNKRALVYLPYTWLQDTKDALFGIGFAGVFEMDSYKTVSIGKHLKLTFIVNGLDSIFVLEHKGKVYLNLNDAFNATHLNFLKLFAKKLNTKWPQIDYLMCGVGGAGYFPNAIHTPYKNDEEIGILREQFLMKLFCEFVLLFNPKIAIPFLPGFVLLEPNKLWINQIRQARSFINTYFKEISPNSNVEFWHLYPGDSIYKDVWQKKSPYYELVQNDDWGKFAEQQYAGEISNWNPATINNTNNSIEDICLELNGLFVKSCRGIAVKELMKLNFIITLSDIPESAIHVLYINGKLVAQLKQDQNCNPNLVIRTNATRLLYSITELWGGDVFFIGYGADIDILITDCIKDNLDILSLRVLSVFPSAMQNIRRQPWRAFRYFYHNKIHAVLALKQKLFTNKTVNKLPFNERSHWIQISKCETCLLCDLPLLTNSFAEKIF
jgi:hypothetical protein